MRKVKIKDNGGRNGQPSKSNIYLGERFRFREDTKHIGKWLLQKSLTFHSMVNLSTSGPQSYSCDRLWTGSMGACKSDKVILGGMGHWVPVRALLFVYHYLDYLRSCDSLYLIAYPLVMNILPMSGRPTSTHIKSLIWVMGTKCRGSKVIEIYCRRHST